MPTFSQGDVPVGNLAAAGLRVPSVTRAAKIATIEATDASRLGAVAPAVFDGWPNVWPISLVWSLGRNGGASVRAAQGCATQPISSFWPDQAERFSR